MLRTVAGAVMRLDSRYGMKNTNEKQLLHGSDKVSDCGAGDSSHGNALGRRQVIAVGGSTDSIRQTTELRQRVMDADAQYIAVYFITRGLLNGQASQHLPLLLYSTSRP